MSALELLAQVMVSFVATGWAKNKLFSVLLVPILSHAGTQFQVTMLSIAIWLFYVATLFLVFYRSAATFRRYVFVLSAVNVF